MPLNYSPWGQASDAMLGTSQSMNQVALGVAKIRYQQALQAQRQAIAMGQLAVRQHLAEQQGQYYQSRAGESSAKTQLDRAKLESANQLEQGYRNLYRPDMSQGPTQEGAAMMTMADIAGPAARNAALGNEAYRLLLPHNIASGAIAVNPVSGEELARNPAPEKYHNVPPGDVVLDQNGIPIYTAPGKPTPDKTGNLLPEFYRLFGEGKVPQPGTGDPVESILYKTMTNVLSGASQGATHPNKSGPTSTGGDVRKDAMDAISRGANPDAVKKRYKELTGMDADF